MSNVYMLWSLWVVELRLCVITYLCHPTPLPRRQAHTKPTRRPRHLNPLTVGGPPPPPHKSARDAAASGLAVYFFQPNGWPGLYRNTVLTCRMTDVTISTVTPSQILMLRVRLGWTRERLAQEVGVHSRTVRRWEDGECVPSGLALAGLSGLSMTAARTDSIPLAGLRLHGHP